MRILTTCGLFLTLAAASLPTWACTAPDSVMSYRTPKKETKAKLRKTPEGIVLERIPAFSVSLKDVLRAPGKDSMPCGQYGSITVQVDWPASSLYRLDEVGFYFRVVDGADEAGIFGDHPVVGKISGNSMRLFFVFDDEEPERQKPWNYTVEAFAVGPHMEIGPVTRFQLKSTN